MIELKYSKKNCEIMINYENVIRDRHINVWKAYQKRFDDLALKLDISFYWMKYFRIGVLNNESKVCYSRPAIEPGNYSYFVQYEVKKDRKIIRVLAGDKDYHSYGLFDSLYISHIKKTIFSLPYIKIYNNANTIPDMLDKYLFKLNRFGYEIAGYEDDCTEE